MSGNNSSGSMAVIVYVLAAGLCSLIIGGLCAGFVFGGG